MIVSPLYLRPYVAALLSAATALLFNACSTTEPSLPAMQAPAFPADYQRHTASGHQAFERGNLSLAERSYLQAAAQAQASDHPDLAALAHYHLALLQYHRGDLTSARTHIDQAADWHNLAAQPQPIADLILRARIELAGGRAQQALTYSLAAADASDDPDMTAAAKLIMARALLQLGDAQQSSALLESLTTTHSDLPALLQADAAHLQGALLQHRGDDLAAAQAYEAAADLYTHSNAWLARAECRAAAAQAWHRGGKYQRSQNAWRRAIRAAEALQRPDLVAAWKQRSSLSDSANP